MKIQGNIITGEFDEKMNEFTLQEIKYFATQSTLRLNQFNTLYNYLSKHINEGDRQVLTLYDQMPVFLTKQEMEQLIKDLDRIKPLYH
ncbi:hypothetical protein [Thalassobacillus sp. C254]|uniref:hypothetical protein n=1 Tax=Thalassobacillus sp. C254 TaxID=1225341 RepID=UPI0006D2B9F4|nr:hypothetical protein [Thalassobacillus sp. C254]